MNRRGQVLIEFPIVILFVVLPLVFGGGTWFWLEFDRSKCAWLGFFQARRELILTGKSVHHPLTCGRIREEINLSDLESLDQNKGGLSLHDYENQASQLWGAASSWYQQFPGSGSTKSSPGPNP